MDYALAKVKSAYISPDVPIESFDAVLKALKQSPTTGIEKIVKRIERNGIGQPVVNKLVELCPHIELPDQIDAYPDRAVKHHHLILPTIQAIFKPGGIVSVLEETHIEEEAKVLIDVAKAQSPIKQLYEVLRYLRVFMIGDRKLFPLTEMNDDLRTLMSSEPAVDLYRWIQSEGIESYQMTPSGILNSLLSEEVITLLSSVDDMWYTRLQSYLSAYSGIESVYSKHLLAINDLAAKEAYLKTTLNKVRRLMLILEDWRDLHMRIATSVVNAPSS
jgi:hypothetical protein